MGCLLAWHSSARKGTASRAPGTSAPGHLSSGGGTPSKYYVGAFNGGKKVHFSAVSLRVPQSLCGRHRQGRRLEGAEQFCGPGRTTPLVPPPALFNLDLRRFRQARWLASSASLLRRWPFTWSSAGLGKCIVLFYP